MAIIINKVLDSFTQIPNDLLTDNNLSNGAKVVFCYLASKPTSWQVYNADVKKALNIKTNNALAKYWKELIEAGWITRQRKKDNQKLDGGFIYTIEFRKNTYYDNSRITENNEYVKKQKNKKTKL